MNLDGPTYVELQCRQNHATIASNIDVMSPGATCRRCGYFILDGTVHHCQSSSLAPVIVERPLKQDPVDTQTERLIQAIERFTAAVERLEKKT